jgi:hypothetical protein
VQAIELCVLLGHRLHEDMGTEAYLGAIPMRRVTDYTWNQASYNATGHKIRALMKSKVSAEAFTRAWECIDRPVYRVTNVSDNGRVTVRGLGGSWEVTRAAAGEELIAAFQRRRRLVETNSPRVSRPGTPRAATPGVTAEEAMRQLHRQAGARSRAEQNTQRHHQGREGQRDTGEADRQQEKSQAEERRREECAQRARRRSEREADE